MNIGRYEVVEQLGRGGMATVYRARDPRFEREVAIKLLPREFMHDPNFKARFVREAQTVARLEHPAIVPVHDFGEHEGQLYLVMRHMSGGSLADLIEHGALSVEQAGAVVLRVAAALDYAHARGVIHRDLKPGNVLFDDTGHAYLADFGIARLVEATLELTKSGVYIGTPAYMSPEQVRGDLELDGRSDVYALGIILFEMLTGKQPYTADTPTKLMMKHVLEPVPHLRDLDPAQLSAADQIVAQAMAKDREQRFASPAELAEAFVVLLGAESPELIAAVPITSVGEPPRGAWFRLRWSWILAGALLLVTVGSALAFGATARSDAKPTPEPSPARVLPSETAVPSLTPTTVVSPTNTPTVSNSRLIWAVVMQDAACRAGPGTVFEVLGFIAAGQSALTHGMDLEGEWWWIQSPDGSRMCWISDLLVSFQGDQPELPILTPEPTPLEVPATATETPIPPPPPPTDPPTATATRTPPPPDDPCEDEPPIFPKTPCP